MSRTTRYLGRSRGRSSRSNTSVDAFLWGSAAVDPGLELINERAAGFFVIDEDDQLYANKVPGTSDFMQRGSTTGVDTNDPVAVAPYPLAGTWFPEVVNQGVHFPAQASPTGAEFVIEATIQYFKPATGTGAGIACQAVHGTNQRVWSVLVRTNGTLRVSMSPNGSGYWAHNGSYSLDTHHTVGDVVDIRVTMGLGASRFLRVETAPHGETLVQRSYETGGAIAQWSSFFSTNTPVGIGYGYSTDLAVTSTSDVYGDRIFSVSLNGSEIFDGTNGTVLRTNTGLKVARVPANVGMASTDQTDDWFDLPASCTPTFDGVTGEYTILITSRHYDSTPLSTYVESSAESATDNGMLTFQRTNGEYVASVRGPGFSDSVLTGVPEDAVMVRGAVQEPGVIKAYVHGLGLAAGTSTSVRSPAHSTPRLAYRKVSSPLPAALDIFSVVVFQEALTLEEADTVSLYLKGLAS